MIRVYQFNDDRAYMHCYSCGKNIELTSEQAESWKTLECPNCKDEEKLQTKEST